jgi:hypothetical protein
LRRTNLKNRSLETVLPIALAKFRERQIKVLDFWVEDNVLTFKIMRPKEN